MHQNADFSASEADQSTRNPTFLDTDIGDNIDDALALALAVQSPEIQLVGISTVFGETTLRAHLAAHLLTVFGRSDIPVAAGVGQPLSGLRPPAQVGQGDILSKYLPAPVLSPLSGPELLIQSASEHAGRLSVLCIGPLSNVATALRQEPRLAKRLRRIFYMGGSSKVPLMDRNTRSDIEAARIVFSAGIPLTCVSMDTTMFCQLRRRDLARLRKSPTSRAQLLNQLIALWQEQRPPWQIGGPLLHDPLTVAALCHPSVLTFREMPLRLSTQGFFQGIAIPQVLGGTLVEVSTHVAVDEARAWMMQRWLS